MGRPTRNSVMADLFRTIFFLLAKKDNFETLGWSFNQFPFSFLQNFFIHRIWVIYHGKHCSNNSQFFCSKYTQKLPKTSICSDDHGVLSPPPTTVQCIFPANKYNLPWFWIDRFHKVSKFQSNITASFKVRQFIHTRSAKSYPFPFLLTWNIECVCAWSEGGGTKKIRKNCRIWKVVEQGERFFPSWHDWGKSSMLEWAWVKQLVSGRWFLFPKKHSCSFSINQNY